MQDDTPRSRKHYPDNKQTHVQQHGGDELPAPERENGSPDENRNQMGVNDEHKTKTMERQHRGTFP
jgi:hypothetical protein